jgi:hypothetical protein
VRLATDGLILTAIVDVYLAMGDVYQAMGDVAAVSENMKKQL